MTDPITQRALAGIRNCPDHSHWQGERLDSLLERVVRDMKETAHRPRRNLPPEVAALYGRDPN